MTVSVTPQDDVRASAPEWTSVQTLGYANRFATWDSEFRYDGRIRVPMGVKIQKIRYSYYGNDNATVEATEFKRGQGGTGQEWELIDLTFLNDSDVLTFTLRGDLNVDADPRPDYSRKYPILVEVLLSDGKSRTVRPQVEVLAGAWQKSDGEMVGRPFVRLPYDHNWQGSPNSQAGFGYVSDDGYIPSDKFIVDLVNLRQGESGVPSNNSTSVYWQLVHEDGTPSKVSPVPQLLENLQGHRDGAARANTALGELDLLKAGDKPGYYRFLVWPQSTDPDNSPSALRWDESKPEDAFQIGSVYFRYEAPHGVAFSVSPGGPPDVKLERGGGTGYPGVRLDSDADGTVPPQTVVVSLPQGVGLQFVEEGDPGYQLTVQDSYGVTRKYGPGTLSQDGLTLTFTDVDPALSGHHATSRAWVAVKALDRATLGDTHLTFQVGGRSERSTTVRVVDEVAE